MCVGFGLCFSIITFFCIYFEEVTADPQVLSAVINTDKKGFGNLIQVNDPPDILSDKNVIKLEYECMENTVVGVEIVTNFDKGDKNVKVFKRSWLCPDQNGELHIRSKKLRLRLPASLAYNYNIFNPNVLLTSGTKLRAWIINGNTWNFCKKSNDCYLKSRKRVSYASNILPPYSRPFYRRQCRKWSWDIITIATAQHIPVCPMEQEVVDAIEYPVVLDGLHYGVYRQLHPYNNPVLEQQRLERFTKPRFTVAVWVYILEYCPGPTYVGKTCGIMYHFNWKSEIRTPMIMLNPEGDVHVQVQYTDESYVASRTHTPLPLKQWIRLVLFFNVNRWTLAVNYGKDFKNISQSSFVYEGLPIYMDDTEGLFTFGGGDTFQGFKGYIGQATIYRNRFVEHSQIPYPSLFHPMFELKLSLRDERCHRYMSWVDYRIFLYKTILQYKVQANTCSQPFYELITEKRSRDGQVTCRLKAKKQRRHWAMVDKIVRTAVYANTVIDVKNISDQLFDKANALIEEDIAAIPKVVPLLKQSACYGNSDAMFTLSVILNNGLFVKSDEIQSQAFLMLAALESHRLSELTLGHKHRYGLDGVTLDLEQSYRYYKYVADTTRQDKEIHRDTDVLTESIRLTDEAALREQTDEDGDVFYWLKHQAKQGVLSAQTRIGRLLYWGSHGLKRNLADAIEYFRMSAETGDAQSQYDYGIVLMRGQGTEKDIDKGLKHISKAAKQVEKWMAETGFRKKLFSYDLTWKCGQCRSEQNDQALNALGWHAREFVKDDVKAAEYFEQAFKLGNPDAAYNLGLMYLLGHYPGSEVDADLALDYFSFAGQRGQLDAGVAIAHQTIKGTGKQSRNVYAAAEWSRFIAEKNPAIGYILRKAVKAYRDGNTDLSLFYYAMAADAGLEVGSFNMAWLCEENKNGIVSFIEKECQWRHYNLSTQREPQFVDSYALIKMGDYYWYGCRNKRDVNKAARYYAEAVAKHNPQAVFNVAFMLEEGANVSKETLDFMRVPRRYQKNNVTLLDYLYTRCKESKQSEAYIPCSIALWRLHINVAWTQYQTILKIAGFTGVLSILTASSYVLVRSHFHQQQQNMNTI